jgi:hypothetical protein
MAPVKYAELLSQLSVDDKSGPDFHEGEEEFMDAADDSDAVDEQDVNGGLVALLTRALFRDMHRAGRAAQTAWKRGDPGPLLAGSARTQGRSAALAAQSEADLAIRKRAAGQLQTLLADSSRPRVRPGAMTGNLCVLSVPASPVGWLAVLREHLGGVQAASVTDLVGRLLVARAWGAHVRAAMLALLPHDASTIEVCASIPVPGDFN